MSSINATENASPKKENLESITSMREEFSGLPPNSKACLQREVINSFSGLETLKIPLKVDVNSFI
jgi:hypothetical protein